MEFHNAINWQFHWNYQIWRKLTGPCEKNHIKTAYALFLLFINSSRNRGLLFSLLGILTLVIAIGVTAGTASSASDKPGLYVVYIGESSITTQYMINPTIVYLVKMEYGWNFSISGLRMMVKSGLEKIYFEIPPCAKLFFLLHKNAQNCNYSNNNDLLCA